MTPIKVERSIDGSIKYPVIIGANLKILNFGIIDTRPQFHSGTNIFPIGFKSIRTHQSALKIGERADYINEIFEDNGKPMFKTTCLENPKHPYIKDNCSGIWCDIIKKINDVTKAR